MKDVWKLPAIAPWEKSCGKHPTQKPLSVLTISKNRKLEIENPKTAATYRQKIGGFNDKKEIELFLLEEPKEECA
ncbi:MAG: hypothetical protein L6Q54_10685 [Leptospiraceae bacterium]|nr:hypothetical protein [Leptospiraceae bacterium]